MRHLSEAMASTRGIVQTKGGRVLHPSSCTIARTVRRARRFSRWGSPSPLMPGGASAGPEDGDKRFAQPRGQRRRPPRPPTARCLEPRRRSRTRPVRGVSGGGEERGAPSTRTASGAASSPTTASRASRGRGRGAAIRRARAREEGAAQHVWRRPAWRRAASEPDDDHAPPWTPVRAVGERACAPGGREPRRRAASRRRARREIGHWLSRGRRRREGRARRRRGRGRARGGASSAGTRRGEFAHFAAFVRVEVRRQRGGSSRGGRTRHVGSAEKEQGGPRLPIRHPSPSAPSRGPLSSPCARRPWLRAQPVPSWRRSVQPPGVKPRRRRVRLAAGARGRWPRERAPCASERREDARFARGVIYGEADREPAAHAHARRRHPCSRSSMPRHGSLCWRSRREHGRHPRVRRRRPRRAPGMVAAPTAVVLGRTSRTASERRIVSSPLAAVGGLRHRLDVGADANRNAIIAGGLRARRPTAPASSSGLRRSPPRRRSTGARAHGDATRRRRAYAELLDAREPAPEPWRETNRFCLGR